MTVQLPSPASPARPRSAPRPGRRALVLLLAAALVAGGVVLTARLVAAWWRPAAPAGEADPSPVASDPLAALLGGEPGAADGVLPEGAGVWDTELPGVSGLDPALLAALQTAAGDAAGDGVEFTVNSGWRSAAYQDRMLREAVSEYGSAEEAARWVASAETSEHVAGRAVDLGGVDATLWLEQYGAAYGLCRSYDNEPWHFELQPDAPSVGCAPSYPDPSFDPRLAG
ncbi:M15 family metallopeptidase [Leucobacter allii]|uniref:M15 family metallopeptidase n=1 Tax=Leucobacter allii TaxID=2932247 RepID=UPI001FD52EBC|nr:M15 family metallopeptidase [Leucobacter allii]UOR00623.1 M15 family metallopeptidase [Leucobacter allii]